MGDDVVRLAGDPRPLLLYGPLDEFVFRHNRRLNLAAAFQALLGLRMTRDPTTYATISGARDSAAP